MHHKTLEVSSRESCQMISLDGLLKSAIREWGLRDGLLTVYVPHTTAGVTINENADPDVVHDLLAGLDAAVPLRQGFYRHGEGNSAAHIKSSLVGCSARVPVIDGRMALGTWQSVFFCEFDGPRTRRVLLTAAGR
jgi:secondary thiamine-phosphate synthase enzyme